MVSVRGNQTNNKVTASASTSTNNRAEVRPVNINNQVEATNNLAKYYSEISQDWAVGEGLIQGIDYSSKTYAQQAKESATEAKASLDEAKGYTANAVEQIQTVENLALSNISMLEQSVSSSIEQGIQTIGETSSQALTDLQTASNGIISEIEELNTDVIDEINDLADTVLEEIADAGGGDNLKYSNITNCLLEVPQRITLSANGSLYTINSDSTFIFPYGMEIIGNSSDEPEIVGTLTVDAEGGYSGFNITVPDDGTSNYIVPPTSSKSEWQKIEYVFKFKMGENGGGLFSNPDGSEMQFLNVYPTGIMFIDDSFMFSHNNESGLFTPGNIYWLKLICQVGQCPTAFISTDGITYNELVNEDYDPDTDYLDVTGSAFLDGVDIAVGVYATMGFTHFPFDGTLYIKDTIIKMDDEVFWSFELPTIRNLAEECPIGSIFNDVFVVVDTQQANGKCFVWAKPIADIGINPPRMEKGLGIITNAGHCLTGNPELFRSSNAKPAETTIQFWYDTKANIVKRLSNTGSVVAEGYSLPIFAFDTSFTDYITQVFNGFGYMDSVAWVDKDVKGLIPKRFNSDGSYKNIKWTNDKLLVSNGQLFSDANCLIQLDGLIHHSKYWGEYSTPPTASGSNGSYYNTTQNAFYYNTGSTWVEANVLRLIDITGTTTITSFNPKQPFRITDNAVSKSGDTMTGNLNFRKSDTVDFTNTNNTVYSEAGIIYFRDKNDEVCGQIRNYFNDYNNLATAVESRRSVNGTIINSQIATYIDKDGNSIATAPNPPQADSSNKIATTSFCDGKWIAKELTIVNNVKLANTGTITYSLADYLPKDNNIYEVMISFAGYFDKGQYSFNTSFYTVFGPYGRTRQVSGSITTPVGTAKELRLYPTSFCSGDNELTIKLNAYRKVR